VSQLVRAIVPEGQLHKKAVGAAQSGLPGGGPGGAISGFAALA
jgi:hypothetical protein